MMITIMMLSFYSANAQTIVNSLAELREAVEQNNQTIVMTPGTYSMSDLDSDERNIICSGSNNSIDLTGVHITCTVGSVSDRYIIISGDNNTLRGMELEDVYSNGMTEVTDFSAYNKDRETSTVCKGLKGAPDITITGNGNLLVGIKLTVRGSYPYGYGSMYGIGSDHVFYLDKRCGINITGVGNTIDSTEVQQRAFGHGIYMQGDADQTVIKNTLVEGRTRAYAELYEETETYDLPYQSGYVMPYEDNRAIPTDEVFSLSEDGFRSYGSTGSVTLENCTAKMMRGGVRLYLASSATVTNCKSIDCGITNYNVTNNGEIINSSGNFSYDNLLDFPLSRKNTNIELTIIPSPNATGPHDITEIDGSGHTIVFHRTPGPLDPNLRSIVVIGDNCNITNETEYPIVLKSTANANTIVSCGVVVDNGTNNNITQNNCTFDAALTIEAEDYTNMLGVETTTTSDEGEGSKVSNIDADDWMEYEITIPSTGTYYFDYRISGVSNGNFSVEMNGEIIEANTFDATDGDEIWETIRSSSPIYLSEGVDTIHILANSAGWNLNWLALTPECYKSQITSQITTFDLQGVEFSKEEQSEVTVFPGFSVSLVPLSTVGGSWSWSGPNGFSSNEEVVSLSDIQKCQGGNYIATFLNACGVETIDTFSVNVQDSLFIEADKYDAMSGVLLEKTTDLNGDSIVTSITTGDWMEYEIKVPFSALYRFSYRVASENAINFDVSINTKSIDQVVFNNTGGNQSWTTINTDSTVYLKAGIQTLRISSKSDDWNINWIELKATDIVTECNLPYNNDGFTVRNNTIEWSSGLMDISCESDVNIHVIVDGIGDLGESDYLSIYYKLDDEQPILLSETIGDINQMMISSQH
ncbi:carbohydrate-binding protein [Saccharicrinis fermentans]|nr:carbohydrate-binding protein [Saccharicrinis fermentans]